MKNSILIESLKRLYSNDKVAISKLQELKEKRTIGAEEYDYIVSEKKAGD